MATIFTIVAGWILGSKSGPKQESDTVASNKITILGSHNNIVNLYEAKQDHQANFTVIEVGLELTLLFLLLVIIFVAYKKFYKK